MVLGRIITLLTRALPFIQASEPVINESLEVYDPVITVSQENDLFLKLLNDLGDILQ